MVNDTRNGNGHGRRLRGRRLRSGVTAVVALSAVGTLGASTLASASTSLVKISSDPYTNTTSQHQTQVEPDAFAFGKTIVAVFQSGRFSDGGASNIGWATSTNSGATWKKGFLPGTTTFATPAGIYPRVSDPSVVYDAKHKVWIASLLGLKSTSGPVDVIASRSTDGGKHWANPVPIDTTGAFNDKNWSGCDNTPTSPHYGNCYTEYDVFSAGGLEQVRTSTDGGATWGAPKGSADNVTGIGGEPLTQPNGTVIVPFFNNNGTLSAFKSTDGGATFGSSVVISVSVLHTVAGGFRTRTLPSAAIDKKGKVTVTWEDCRFEASCSANDIVMSTSTNGTTWSAVKRIPIDAVGSGVDHFIPALAVDTATGGNTAIEALTYYYYPNTNCTVSTCKLDVGIVSSTDGGTTWSTSQLLAGPMKLSWLANTNQGNMVGDYVGTAIPPAKTGAVAIPVVDVGKAPTGQTLHEDTYAGALPVVAGTIPVGDDPVLSSGGSRSAGAAQ